MNKNLEHKVKINIHIGNIINISDIHFWCIEHFGPLSDRFENPINIWTYCRTSPRIIDNNAEYEFYFALQNHATLFKLRWL